MVTFQIIISASVKWNEEHLANVLLDRVAREFLSEKKAFELTSEGQKERAMERAWNRAFQAEGTSSREARALVQWELMSAMVVRGPTTSLAFHCLLTHGAHSSSFSRLGSLLSYFYIQFTFSHQHDSTLPCSFSLLRNSSGPLMTSLSCLVCIHLINPSKH